MIVITPGLSVIFAVVRYFLLPFYDLHQELVIGTPKYLSDGSARDLSDSFQVEVQGIDNVYRNPLLGTNLPDPAVLGLPDNGGYALVATSNLASDNQGPAFPLFFSSDLVDWSPRGHVFPAGKWPTWAKSEMWAPEIHFVNNRFVVYYTAGDVDGRLHIGVAVSTTDSPYGPYQDKGSPIVSEPGSLVGAIDAHYFKDPKSGFDYLLWKTDSVFGFESSLIYIRQLNQDGVSFKEESEAVVILRADQASERLTAEGPWLMFHEGVYFLFYSSGWFFEAKYHMRVARSQHLTGPFQKHPRPVIETDWERFNQGVNTTFAGPGHGCVVVDGAGDWWLVYHSWVYGQVDKEPGRLALMDRIHWRDGWPSVGIPSDTPRPAPIVGTPAPIVGKRYDTFKPAPRVTSRELCADGQQMEGVCPSKIK